ncbi:MAG: hypothetical protein AB2A00_17535 [Myxococcota bacterium]
MRVAWIALGLSVVGLVVQLAREPPSTAAVTSSAQPTPPGAPELAALRSSVEKQQRRIRELEESHAQLEDLVDQLRRQLAVARPVTTSSVPGAAQPTPTHDAPAGGGAPPPEIREAVEQAMRDEAERRKGEQLARQGKREQEWLDDTASRLQLDGAQKEKLAEVLSWAVAQMTDAMQKRANGEIPREQMRAQMEEFRTQWDQRIKAVLTSEQAQAFDALEPWERRPPLWGRRRILEE